MAVVASEMKLLFSGDSGNNLPALSLGGGESASEVILSPILNNLFDDVTAAEALAGATEYRCVYVQNDNASSAIDLVKIWVQTNTPSSGTTIAIGLDPAGKNATATGPISPSSSAPSGVTFSTPTNEAGGLSLGKLEAQDTYAIWIRRTVSAATASAANDAFTIGFSGTPL